MMWEYLAILAPIYLAIIGRVCGMPVWKWVGLPLYAAPYAAIVWLLSAPLYAPIAFAWVFVWKLTGHADGFRNYVRDNTLSKVSAPLSKLFGIERNSAAYDALFWAIKGAVIASIPSVALAYHTGAYALPAALFCASFCGYPLAYYLGFYALNRRFGLVNTAWGELLSGFFSGLGFLAFLL